MEDFRCFLLIQLPFELPDRAHQPLSFEPVIEFVDPVIACFTLFAHAEAMPARAKDVKFRFVACSPERVVEACNEGPCACIVLRNGEEDWRQSLRNRRHLVEGSAVDGAA